MALKPSVKPRFATSDLNNGPLGGANVLEPSEAKKDSGWNSGEKPPREYFNWMHRLTYQWIDWLDETVSNALSKSNNLSDLPNAATARTNLGLGTAATVNTGTGAANVPTITQADARYLKQSSNLSDLVSASTARTNLGLGSAATRQVGSTASDLPDITTADARYVKQVTPATETQVGVLEVATDSEARAFLSDAKIITPLKLESAFQGTHQQLSTSGWQVLPGGLILQWFKYTAVNDQTLYTVGFPIAFPNVCLNLQCTLDRNAAFSGAVSVHGHVLSASQCQVIVDSDNATANNQNIFIFAIGY